MRRAPMLLILLLLTLAAACAPKRSLVVLVPDREGHVGRVTLTNPQGTAVLTQANEGVEVAGPKAAPGTPRILPPERIQQTFGAALAAEPPAPRVFVLAFGKASSDLEPQALAELARVCQEIRARDSRDVSINGHTDTTGDAAFNMRLSLERARRVQEYLVAQGIPGEILTTAYHGKGNPRVPTADNVDEPRNRRVEVIVR